MSRTAPVAVAAFFVAATLGALGWRLFSRPTPAPEAPATAVEIPANGPVVIAAAGDVLLLHPVAADAGPRDALARIVRGATFAVANLEMNLLDADTADHASSRPGSRWPFGSPDDAAALKDYGFDALTLANNHAADYGVDGIIDTEHVLDAAGLLHAGTGSDLEEARAPVFAGTRHRIALISLSTSSEEEARATVTRGDISGRPGLSPLRYTADITVDPQRFAALADTVGRLQSGAASRATLSLFGATIHRGARPAIAFRADARDVADILETIRTAHAVSPLVVVSIHSHEPNNASDTPASFVETFAHQAIDAGARLVIGHGPHRLRGLELYHGGAIFYSLGNFIYQFQDLDPLAADEFDSGADLLARVTGSAPASSRLDGLEEDWWWQSVLPVVRFDGDDIASIALYPVDLGVDAPGADKGDPRLAAPEEARDIFDELIQRSAPFGTRIDVANGIGRVRLETGDPRD